MIALWIAFDDTDYLRRVTGKSEVYVKGKGWVPDTEVRVGDRVSKHLPFTHHPIHGWPIQRYNTVAFVGTKEEIARCGQEYASSQAG